jgi:RHS repeat-associated protein
MEPPPLIRTDSIPFNNFDAEFTAREIEAYRYGFQNQEHDNELWSGAVSYKYRVEDPRLGRFFSVDPLAAKYPHNSVYAFSENRVVDAVELEGLEATLVKEEYGWDIPGVGRHDRSHTVISLKADVTNQAKKMTDEVMLEVVNQAKTILINQFKIDDIFDSVELNADGLNTNTSLSPWDVSFVDEVTWKGSKTEPGTLGVTDEIGGTQINKFQILYRGDSPEAIAMMARTLAHELGHGLGLEHPDWEDAMLMPNGERCFTCHPASVSSKDSKQNLMRQSKHTTGTVVEEVQINEVIQEITNDSGATVVNK